MYGNRDRRDLAVTRFTGAGPPRRVRPGSGDNVRQAGAQGSRNPLEVLAESPFNCLSSIIRLHNGVMRLPGRGKGTLPGSDTAPELLRIEAGKRTYNFRNIYPPKAD